MIFIILALFLFLCIAAYIKVAARFGITDKPNVRSSHTDVTVRGGGVIFPVAVVAYAVYTGFEYPYFIAGLILISVISFADDVMTVSNSIRIAIHAASVALIGAQVAAGDYQIWVIAAAAILVIGLINAYNFMDGINGLTALYSVTATGTLVYINEHITRFVESGYLLSAIVAVLIFGMFNIRKKAIVFAGDVGSVSIAFFLAFVVLSLIITDAQLKWILLFGVYGLDSVVTIILRICRGENIFKAHRSHLYQFLANEKKLSHIYISGIYSLIQLLLNIVLITTQSGFIIILSYLCILSFYLFLRLNVEGRSRLFKKY